jgi:hypothetical protein
MTSAQQNCRLLHRRLPVFRFPGWLFNECSNRDCSSNHPHHQNRRQSHSAAVQFQYHHPPVEDPRRQGNQDRAVPQSERAHDDDASGSKGQNQAATARPVGMSSSLAIAGLRSTTRCWSSSTNIPSSIPSMSFSRAIGTKSKSR